MEEAASEEGSLEDEFWEGNVDVEIGVSLHVREGVSYSLGRYRRVNRN